MSTTRDHGDYVFECDGCHATIETGTSNFEAARNILRRRGWQPIRGGGQGDDAWKRKCSNCQRGTA